MWTTRIVSKSNYGFGIGLLLLMWIVSSCTSLAAPSASVSSVTVATITPAAIYDAAHINNAPDTSGWKTYRDPEDRYELIFPDTWVVVPSEQSPDTVHFVNPLATTGAEQAAVTVTVQQKAQTLSAVMEAATETIRQQNGVASFEDVSHGDVLVNGEVGYEQQIHYLLAEVPMAQWTVLIGHPHYTFALSLSTQQASVATYSPIFKQILSTFQMP
ncbi:MAG: hypothetical protein U0175_06770 [Caldilineaceae bacterium]